MSTMSTTLWAAAMVVTFSTGLVVWWLLMVPRPLRWVRVPSWGDVLLTGLTAHLFRHLSQETARRAQVLHLAPRKLLVWSLLMALMVGVALGFVLHAVWVGGVLTVLGFYGLPSLRVSLSYQAYQRAMREAFETQVLLLRIYFDLGMPVVVAFRAMRIAVSGVAQREIDRVLSDEAAGARDQAFTDWAQRTQLLEYQLLANTIVQQRGRSLAGNALKPLEILLSANRQQTMKMLTDKLMTSAAAVPIFATLSVLILYLYALMVNIRGLSALHFHW